MRSIGLYRTRTSVWSPARVDKLSVKKMTFGYSGEVWQPGFSEVRVEGRESFLQHREYIAQNPVKAGLVDSPEKFPYCFTYLAGRKAAGAKAL